MRCREIRCRDDLGIEHTHNRNHHTGFGFGYVWFGIVWFDIVDFDIVGFGVETYSLAGRFDCVNKPLS